ncbi:NAD(P)H-dependent FMN reductase [Aquimarina sp. MAR_2010_214]|uniref:NADPH-dependent FMN reductase n=1 Tax=Aquimarina sp. MAR_2010_214 TaxID=1250026 RepID=UPI000C708793|nr:NAD(P)H-dependent oxidoreductase [Aquimarina sp. MAR_2010_214]PKV52062.1 NAD(P)H-dependent FMN reductase [Aquimarina sp. MAR_2010_214]
MKKIIAFAGSNSSTSINHKLVEFVVSEIKGYDTRIINLVNYAIPMYSEDEEKNNGFPGMVMGLKQEISEADALIISVNEHNGSWGAFFKNVIDWLSRLDRNFLEGKKILLMSTSPGKRGGVSSLEYAKNVFPRFGAEIVESFSFPSFYDNFSIESNTVTDETLLLGLNEVLSTFAHQI